MFSKQFLFEKVLLLNISKCDHVIKKAVILIKKIFVFNCLITDMPNDS